VTGGDVAAAALQRKAIAAIVNVARAIAVRASEQFQRGEAASRLLKIPTGDGMALVFYTSPEAPVRVPVHKIRVDSDNKR
jgi:hypothetical protein